MANQINLDRSQRVDITCKRGDTFNLNLELKDDNNQPLTLGYRQTGNVTDDGYSYILEVRNTDTDDHEGAADTQTPAGHGLSITGVIDPFTSNPTASSENPGLVVFSAAHTVMEDLASGIYVYDIQQKIEKPGNDNDITGTSDNAIDSVETLLYGIFKIVEDVTVAV